MTEFTITVSSSRDDMSTDRLEQILLDALHKEAVLSGDPDISQLEITGVTPNSYYEELKSRHRAEIEVIESKQFTALKEQGK
jgi:hypothetical protein